MSGYTRNEVISALLLETHKPTRIKRTLTILAFLLLSFAARCDVIYFPIQYSLISYSAEFIYSYELAKKIKSSTVYWAGIGTVGSFFYLEAPMAGMEVAIERRRYFKSEQYKGFFISGYIGAAYMTNLRDYNDIGLVPGFKINYKAELSRNLVLEPYLGISIPVTLHVDNSFFFMPFPVATVGIRLGICTLKRNN